MKNEKKNEFHHLFLIFVSTRFWLVFQVLTTAKIGKQLDTPPSILFLGKQVTIELTIEL